MRPDVIVMLKESGHVVESWIVEFECLPEPFDLPLRRRFSSGTEDMLNAMLCAEACEPAWTVVTPILRPMI